MKLNVIRANPAGNITLFVLTPVEKEIRGKLSEKLMAYPGMESEQVAFVVPPVENGDFRIEMMGGEFCGNASRAAGLLYAKLKGESVNKIRLEVSGAEKAIDIEIDCEAGKSDAEMPLPKLVRPVDLDGFNGEDIPALLVHLGGIAHIVVEREADVEFFKKNEKYLSKYEELDAYGMIFLDGRKMTPLVKVIDSNSLVFEGSCGSGSLAAAIYDSKGMMAGDFERTYIQPAGEIEVKLQKFDGNVIRASIGGSVSLEDETVIEIDL